MPVLAVLIAVTLLFWLAHRADRWWRHRTLMKELKRLSFDTTRLGTRLG